MVDHLYHHLLKISIYIYTQQIAHEDEFGKLDHPAAGVTRNQYLSRSIYRIFGYTAAEPVVEVNHTSVLALSSLCPIQMKKKKELNEDLEQAICRAGAAPVLQSEPEPLVQNEPERAESPVHGMTEELTQQQAEKPSATPPPQQHYLATPSPTPSGIPLPESPPQSSRLAEPPQSGSPTNTPLVALRTSLPRRNKDPSL